MIGTDDTDSLLWAVTYLAPAVTPFTADTLPHMARQEFRPNRSQASFMLTDIRNAMVHDEFYRCARIAEALVLRDTDYDN